MRGTKVDAGIVARRVQDFWTNNKQFLDTGDTDVAREFIDADFARPLTEGKRVTVNQFCLMTPSCVNSHPGSRRLCSCRNDREETEVVVH